MVAAVVAGPVVWPTTKRRTGSGKPLRVSSPWSSKATEILHRCGLDAALSGRYVAFAARASPGRTVEANLAQPLFDRGLIEPLDFPGCERCRELFADAILAESSHCQRNGLPDGGADLCGQPLQFLVGRSIDANTRTLHAYMLALLHACPAEQAVERPWGERAEPTTVGPGG